MIHSVTRRLALGLFAGAALFATPAAAQTYPSRVVKMVVPYPAGGPTDVIARIVAEELGRDLGQNVVVENLAGASGAVGTRTVAKAEPDGYTIIFGNNQTHGNNMFLLKEPGYDAVKDFAPLAGAGAFEHVFVVKNDLPARTIPELIALAKKDPGKLNYGSTGVGSGSHLATELFMTRTGIQMTHVPFRGAAPLVTDIMGGRIDVSNSTLPSVLGQFQAGQMRAIGIASPKRNPQAPEVPTIAESGFPGYEATSDFALLAPAGTPAPVLRKLAAATAATMKNPEVLERLRQNSIFPTVGTPEEWPAYFTAESAKWGDVIKTRGITLE